MPICIMTDAAKILKINRTTLAYQIHIGNVTATEKFGPRVVLVDTEKAFEELEKAGVYKRLARKRKSST